MAAGGKVGGRFGSLLFVKSHVPYLEGTFRSCGELCLVPTAASDNGNVPSPWLGPGARWKAESAGTQDAAPKMRGPLEVKGTPVGNNHLQVQ